MTEIAGTVLSKTATSDLSLRRGKRSLMKICTFPVLHPTSIGRRRHARMSRSLLGLVTFICVFLCLAPSADGCLCVPGIFGTYFKGATSVVKVKVIRAKTSPTLKPSPCVRGKPCSVPFPGISPTEFTLKLLRTYKGCAPKFAIFRARSVLVFCGQFLGPGEVYMLNLGRPVRDEKGKLYFGLSSCQGNRLFSTLSRNEKRFLSRKARTNKSKCRFSASS